LSLAAYVDKAEDVWLLNLYAHWRRWQAPLLPG